MNRAVAWRWAFAVAVVVQGVVLYVPRSPDGPEIVPHVDKIVHVVIFALAVWTGRRAGLGIGPLEVVFLAHAGLSEMVQHLAFAERGGDPADLVADTVGVLGAALVPTRGRRIPHDRSVTGTMDL